MDITSDEDKEKFLSKWLDTQLTEQRNKELELNINKEIRLKEMETAVELEKIEKDKLSLHLDLFKSIHSKKFKVVFLMIVVGIGVLSFSCYLLMIGHSYGVTAFTSTLSFVGGIFGGLGIKGMISNVEVTED